MRIRLPARLRRSWLRWTVIGTSLLGVPLSYLTGAVIAGREAAFLDHARFGVAPEEVTPFIRLSVSGRIDVEIACADEMRVEAGDHADRIYFFQRVEDRLRIAAQQIDSTEPFSVRIHTPARITYVDLQRGATISMPACSVDESQLTALSTAGSVIAASGNTQVLNLFGSTGSRFIAGPDGPLEAIESVVDMVLGATADLCAISGRVTGTASIKGFIHVPPGLRVVGPPEGLILRDCPLEPDS